MLVNFFRGFCMALADSVPGVSGGTVAFILGFYDRFINSLDAIFYGNKQEKYESFLFLLKLMFGWIVGFILAVTILTSIFDKHIYKISSLFIGFILFSIPIVMKEESKNMKITKNNIVAGILGIVIVVGISGISQMFMNQSIVDLGKINLFSGMYIFICAMFAISAMILPGISGSTLLLVFGLYIPIMNAIKQVILLDMTYLPSLIVFAFGIVVGIIFIVKIVKIALSRYRSFMIYLVIGMMIGSLYSIIIGPTTLATPKELLNISNFSFVYFGIGGAIILGMKVVKSKLESQ